MANLLEEASILLTPTAYNDGSMLSVKPENGDGDFTFSRNSAATRVNAQGLVENVQILSSNLVLNGDFSEEGSEEVLNGDFDNGTTNWNAVRGNIQSVNDECVFTLGGTEINSLVQSNVFTVGKSYLLEFYAKSDTYNTNIFTAYLGVDNIVQEQTVSSEFQKWSYYISPNQTNLQLGIFYSALYENIIFDNISVKEVGQDWTLGTGWSIGDDKATVDNTANANLDQSTLVSGKKYKVSFEISDLQVGGSVTIGDIVTPSAYTATSNGSQTFNYTATNSTLRVRGKGYSCSITNISVKEITDETNLPRINYEGFSYQDSLGSEEVVNGDFATDTDWNTASNWTISNGSANADGSSGGSLSQSTIPTVIGKTYKVEYTILNYVSGSFRFGYGGTSESFHTSNGTYISYRVATSTNSALSSSSINFIGSIDNVSVKEYSGQEVVPNSGCGSWLLEPQSTNLYLNSETLSTQNNTTSATTYSVSFYGTGTITFSGAYSGALVGTGLSDRVSATFSAASGTLVSAVSGTCTKAQLEQKSHTTSYIPTLGASSTRLKDIATNSGNASLINSEEGVLYAEITKPVDSSGDYSVISLSSISDDNVINIGFNPTNKFWFYLKASNSNVLTNSSISATPELYYKIALKYKSGDVSIWINGFEEATYSSVFSFSTSLSQLNFKFSQSSSVYSFYGKTKALAVFKTALTDEQLTALTTI